MLGDWLARRATLTPHKVALIDATATPHREITYAAWNEAANQTAHFFANLGVRKGDRVAVLAKNSVAYLDIWFALGKAGAILQNLNWRLTPAELQGLLEDATPTVVVYEQETASTVEALREVGLPFVRHFVALDNPVHGTDHPFGTRTHQPKTFEAVEVSLEDTWVICYTGGTTGLPKGAMLRHGNIIWNSVNTVMSWGLTPDDLTILNAPLFHVGGLNVFTAPLVHIGGTSIVCREFNVEVLYDLLAQYPVSVYFAVPTMFTAMQQHPRWNDADFSHLRWLISGGAPCPLPIFEKFWARGIEFKTGYGLTEAGPNTFWLPSEQVQAKPGAVGYPLFHIETKIVTPQGEECAAEEAGELLIRGPHVTKGYWNNPAATEHAIQNGWLYTGDLAIRDIDGAYTIVGRSKEMIISGGENIYPAEGESILAAHPAVAEVAVLGVADDKWGEVGWAVVVPLDGTPDPADVLTFARTRLAGYKVPKRVLFVEELPKTGAGKVDKLELTRLYVNGGT